MKITVWETYSSKSKKVRVNKLLKVQVTFYFHVYQSTFGLWIVPWDDKREWGQTSGYFDKITIVKTTVTNHYTSNNPCMFHMKLALDVN